MRWESCRGSLLGETQQQLQRVPVGGDGAWADAALLGQSVGEEALQGGGDRAHRLVTCPESWSRVAARANSSGAADRYQLFRDRNNWYYSDSGVIPMSVLLHA